MKRLYEPNYKGFLILPRATQFLLQTSSLSVTELGYFLLFLTQLDFDPHHKDIYTAILRDDKQLAHMWNTSETTIYRNKVKLMKKGLLQEDKNIYIKSNLLPLFLSKNSARLSKLNNQQLKNIFTNSQNTPFEIEKIIANMQFDHIDNIDTTSNSVSKSMFPSKEDLDFSINKSMNEDVDPDDIPF